MVQLSAILASWLGRRSRLSTPRLRLLVACGAAAGIAGVYNVTIAGALFVAEVVLGSIAMESMGPQLVAAFASSLVSRNVGGAGPYFSSPPFTLMSPLELIPYAAMALVLGVAAPGYIRLLRRSEDAFTALVLRVFPRLALGGLIVGALAIPLMAMLIPFEMTLDYGIVLPLMLVCCRRLLHRQIHTEGLDLFGIASAQATARSPRGNLGFARAGRDETAADDRAGKYAFFRDRAPVGRPARERSPCRLGHS